MWGSSAISRRAWGIQEQPFSDWAACIWISAGAKIWGILLTRKIEFVSLSVACFLGASVDFSAPHDLLSLASFIQGCAFPRMAFMLSLVPPQSQFLYVSVPLHLSVSSFPSLLCFSWHMHLLNLLPKSGFWPPDNTRCCCHPDRQQQAGERQAVCYRKGSSGAASGMLLNQKPKMLSSGCHLPPLRAQSWLWCPRFWEALIRAPLSSVKFSLGSPADR